MQRRSGELEQKQQWRCQPNKYWRP